ncbi:beta-amyrin 28-monooxygenase [Ranunculus cassubicifolius]
MEYLLYITLFISTLTYFLFSRFFKPQTTPPLPPGSMGWPLIGETLQLQRGNKSSNPDNFFITRRKKYNNNIFKTSMIGSKTIMLCGAAGNKFLFTSEKTLNYAFARATELFTSVEDSEWEAMLLREFNVLVKGVFAFPIYFPGTRHYNAVKSAIRRELIKVIEKKRCRRDSEGIIEKDLIEARDENGDLLSEEIADNVVLLMDSGHDTSSAAMMMVMKYLAETPDCYQEVLQEQKAISMQKKSGELLNKDDIQKMKLTPPVQGTLRKAIVDFSYDRYLVPKGWTIWWAAANTHRIANYFPNPDKFDPARFDRDNLTPYTFVPFGGGPRMCPGQEFAKVEILVFLHNLVCKLEFPYEMITIDPMPTSSKGLPVYLFVPTNLI